MKQYCFCLLCKDGLWSFFPVLVISLVVLCVYDKDETVIEIKLNFPISLEA